ncbi:MAG: hypothetical protein HYX71_06330 [Opitutae bacterium]|nr:hypothetical protein [Opitutae bacterium]
MKPPPRPRLDHSGILGPKAFNEELARKNLSVPDRSILNRLILPGGVSPAARARKEYNPAREKQFMSDVLTIARAAAVTDPDNAEALRKAAAKP